MRKGPAFLPAADTARWVASLDNSQGGLGGEGQFEAHTLALSRIGIQDLRS